MENSHLELSRKIRDSFKELTFSPSIHRYAVKGDTLPSVSGLIKKYAKPFEQDRIARNYAKKVGKTKDEVLSDWGKIKDEACRLGTRVHDFGERYTISKYKLDDDLFFSDVYEHLAEGESLLPKEKALVKFWKNKPDHYVPITMELRMFCLKFGYAGTADIILLDTRDDTLVIADYKTNKDLFKNFAGQTLLLPFTDILDTPYGKYTLQLSYYQILLEEAGYKVSRRFLIWLTEGEEGEGKYTIYNTPNYTEKLREELRKQNSYASW